MAFMDDLNKMMSNASKKTKDMADIAKLNASISDEEKKINNLYYQVGKLYVALHPADYEQEFGSVMAQIAEVEAKLSNYRQQLQQLKGVTPCSKCGADVARNSAFCPACGNEMPRTENGVELEKCASCNNFVAKGLRFCTYCGKPMATQAVVAPQQQEEPVGFCSNCGSKLAAGCDFCTECGTKVTE